MDEEKKLFDQETMKKLEQEISGLKLKLEETSKGQKNKLSMVVFSGDLDHAMAAFIIATGARAMGMEVTMFFTFWATPLLRDKSKKVKGKKLIEKMFGWMLPRGYNKAKLGKMNMMGMGTMMMKGLMKKKNVASLDQLVELAGELEVKIFICEMSMDLMGFRREEMIEYPDLRFCGVAKFLEEAMESKIQLFL